MKALKVISTILGVFIVAPIWYYLLYKMLEAVNASELMWFLFWAYIPVSLITSILLKITNDE